MNATDKATNTSRSSLRRGVKALSVAAATTAAAGLLGALVPSLADASTRPADLGASVSSHLVFQTINDPADTTFNQLLGINDEGVIAGYFGSGTPATTHPNKGYTLAPYSNLGFTNENFPGSAQTQVTGLNDYGKTVGFYADAAGNNFGFFMKAGAFHSVTDPNAAGSTSVTQLLSVNNEGQSVGFYNDAAGNAEGFEYNTHTGHFAPVPVPGQTSVMATGINDSGEIVGIATDPQMVTDGFVLEDGHVHLLAYPGASQTQAFGVNDLGQVVGTYTDSAKKTHGFVWTKGSFVSFDDPAGIGTTTANGINNAGDVVGFYTDSNGNTDGFLAEPQFQRS